MNKASRTMDGASRAIRDDAFCVFMNELCSPRCPRAYRRLIVIMNKLCSPRCLRAYRRLIVIMNKLCSPRCARAYRRLIVFMNELCSPRCPRTYRQLRTTLNPDLPSPECHVPVINPLSFRHFPVSCYFPDNKNARIRAKTPGTGNRYDSVLIS